MCYAGRYDNTFCKNRSKLVIFFEKTGRYEVEFWQLVYYV